MPVQPGEARGGGVSEQRESYRVLYTQEKPATLETDLHVLRARLVDIECQLISLLVTVQRALGKEPSVMTRRERRSR